MELTLNRNSWLTRMFFWIENLKAKFYSYYQPCHETDVDLCTFVKAYIFHLPWIVLCQVLGVGIPLTVVVLLPIHAAGSLFWIFPLQVLMMLCFVAMCFGCLVAVFFLADKTSDAASDTRTVVTGYYYAVKNRYCPYIRFKKD